MKSLYTLIVFLIINYCMPLQTVSQSAAGEYYLRGVMEVGSGFKLNTDNTFEFFFTYGALDRFGKGTWEQRGDSIILNSSKKPLQDFKLMRSKKNAGENITVQIQDDNKVILSRVLIMLQSGDSIYRAQTNDAGKADFKACKIDKISLIHEFWPDRYSEFTINDKENNFFEFNIEPWITDVAFDNFTLLKKENALTGKHPLLEKKEYRYEK